jgi:hypothetical protein
MLPCAPRRAVACLLHKNSIDFRISIRFMRIYLLYFPWIGSLEGSQLFFFFLRWGAKLLNTTLSQLLTTLMIFPWMWSRWSLTKPSRTSFDCIWWHSIDCSRHNDMLPFSTWNIWRSLKMNQMYLKLNLTKTSPWIYKTKRLFCSLVALSYINGKIKSCMPGLI